MKSSIHDSRTVVGYSRTTAVILYGFFGAVGLVFGFFLPGIAAWVVQLPWFPFQGPARLITELEVSYLQWVTSLVGLLAGFVLAYISILENLVAAISDREVQLTKDGKTQTIPRGEIQSVFFDGKQLVVLGISDLELARKSNVESPEQFAQAFCLHGYPWSTEGEAYKDRFRRWVPDSPDVTPSANALLKVREKALQKKEKTDIADLRNELAKLGYVVRDEETRQYWRKAKTSRE